MALRLHNPVIPYLSQHMCNRTIHVRITKPCSDFQVNARAIDFYAAFFRHQCFKELPTRMQGPCSDLSSGSPLPIIIIRNPPFSTHADVHVQGCPQQRNKWFSPSFPLTDHEETLSYHFIDQYLYITFWFARMST